MRLWLRCRIDGAALILLALGTITVPILGSHDMPLLRLGTGPAPFALLLPALVASGLVGAAQKGHFVYESISARPTGPLLLAFNLAGVAVVCGLWVGVGALSGDMSFDLMAARNLVGYVGLGLVVLRLVGGVVASASPVLYAVVVAILGSADASLWSWPLDPASSVAATVSAALLLLVGPCAATTTGALRSYARQDLVA